MTLDEFAIIDTFFKRQHSAAQSPLVDLSVGDDAALFRVAHGHQCVVSSDLLIEGRHFFADVAPRTLGHKALAVNLSDMAAMGAQPLGFTLSIGLPRADAAWLREFSAGLFTLADAHHCPLIGGDTTKSEILVINITIFGQVPTGSAIVRSGTCVGDDVWVTGTLGDAAYALDLLRAAPTQANVAAVRSRLEQPTARVKFGQSLRGVAHSMLDISDGLVGDLRHILRASNVRAQIDCDALPLSPSLSALPRARAWVYAVAGGDDYELCFTAPTVVRHEVLGLAQKSATAATRIGTILPVEDNGHNDITWHSALTPDALDGVRACSGFNHFKD